MEKKLSLSKLEYINDNIFFKYIYDNKKQKFNKMTFNSTSEENLKIEVYNLMGASKEIKQLRDSSNNWQTELIKKITQAATSIIKQLCVCKHRRSSNYKRTVSRYNN